LTIFTPRWEISCEKGKEERRLCDDAQREFWMVWLAYQGDGGQELRRAGSCSTGTAGKDGSCMRYFNGEGRSNKIKGQRPQGLYLLSAILHEVSVILHEDVALLYYSSSFTALGVIGVRPCAGPHWCDGQE
jgi:hypothetical protein